jgi:hypothetical protein
MKTGIRKLVKSGAQISLKKPKTPAHYEGFRKPCGPTEYLWASPLATLLSTSGPLSGFFGINFPEIW